MAERAGWTGSVAEFLNTETTEVLDELDVRLEAGHAQRSAWRWTVETLREALHSQAEDDDARLGWHLVLEYELPREGGRRPDVCILTGDEVLVIEVKDTSTAPIAGVDQCRGYVRDLAEYHLASRERDISGVLLVSGISGRGRAVDDIQVVGPDSLGDILGLLHSIPCKAEQAAAWIRSAYRPLPALVEAAMRIFENVPLPQIRQAASAGIPEALSTVDEIASRATDEETYRLVLVSGLPGSGKTLVGLQFVHDFSRERENGERAVFLSGNGPLVEVLQYALRSKVFVQDVHRFVREHGIRDERPVEERVLVFDEAQRAWEREKVRDWYERKRNLEVNRSEPEIFVDVASRHPGGSAILGLVGYGQEIHTGEEEDVGQWEGAVSRSDQAWTVHCPPRLTDHFPNARVEVHEELDLSVSLRTHVAASLTDWVEALLAGEFALAREHAGALAEQRYFLRLTDDLDEARAFMRERYETEPNKTHGLVTSSRARNLQAYGLEIKWRGKGIVPFGSLGPWYYGREGREPNCKALEQAVDEFRCQGLELDGVLLAWGADFRWTAEGWKSPPQPRSKARDPHRLRLNSYRVLLTRARDGMMIFCPPDDKMQGTREALVASGVESLA